MRVLLRDLSPGQLYAIQFRSNDGAGNTSDWSQVQRFTTTNDTIHPGNVNPAGLTWYNTGTSYIAQWTPVTTNEDSTPIHDLRDYHVAITNGSTTVDFYTVNTKYEFTQQQCIQQFGSWQTALTVSVTARDLTYNESRVPATLAVNPLNPPTPSAPGIDTYLGLLMATWNSQTAGGADMNTACKNFNYCEVHVFTQPNQPIPLDNSSMVGRVFADNSGSKYVIPNLTYGQTYYIKLVAVNMLGKKSGPSGESSASPTGVSGLDIKDGRISAEQINWNAENDPALPNAYYSTSQPALADAIGGAFKIGDLWYDTDNNYAVYRYDGTTWQPAAGVGFISGTKLVAGTITADRIATDFFSAAKAYLGGAYIDQAYISSVNAASIKAGSIAANESISAGPANDVHAEMNSTGFYVMAPTAGTAGTPNPTMVPAVKMGTGVGDTFSIIDPNNPDQTLASISSGGTASFQDLYVANSPTIEGTDLLGTPVAGDPVWIPNDPGSGGWLSSRSAGAVITGSTQISGLEPSGSAGIRSEYGVCQYRVPVIQGRTYMISFQTPPFYISATAATNAGEVRIRIREQQDQRSVADQKASPLVGSATAATLSSRQIYFQYVNSINTTSWQDPTINFLWTADYTGYSNMMLTLELAWPSGTDSVVKIPQNTWGGITVVDMGGSPAQSPGMISNGGGTLYAYTTPPPPPPPTTQNYYWEGNYDWVRSYKSNGGYMSNTNGQAFQGQDPSGYNGNQHALYGWNTNIASMLSGASGVTMHLYLYFAHWYYNSGGTAVIGTSGQWGDPGTANTPTYTSNRLQSSGWPVAASRELNITGWWTEWQSGATRSILLGPGPSTSYTYYGYATQAKLKIWYTK